MIAFDQQQSTMNTASSSQIWVGVDIGGTKINVLVVDSQLNELAQLTFATDVTTEENTLNCITSAVLSTIAIANVSLENVAGIGLGIPGKVDPATGHVAFAVNLNWASYPAGQRLEQELGVPCYLQNDVRLAALGIHHFYYPQLENLIYVTVGTGVAAGIILNKEVHRGTNEMAGEFGHMVVDRHGPRCNCGNHGCLETFIAGPAYERAAMQAQVGMLADLRERGEKITAVSVFQAAQQNDATAQMIIDQAGAMLGQGLQNLVMAYDPDKIIVGGGVSHAGPPFLKAILREWQRQTELSPLAAELLKEEKIELAPQNRNFGAWGGIALVQSHAQQVLIT